MANISILTLNCFDISLFTITMRRNRLKRLAQEIIALSPDIVCLQEINFFDTLALMQKTFLQAGYRVFPAGNKRILNRGGLFSATKLPVKNIEYVKYKNQGSLFALDIFERLSERGYHVLSFTVRGKKLTVINTHLHCPFGEYDSSVPKKTSLDQYRQILTQTSPEKRFVLTGDLNIPPNNAIYKDLSRIFRDPLSQTKRVTLTTTNTHRHHLTKFIGRIDYTLLSPDLMRKAKAKIIFNKPVVEHDGTKYHLSDHFGVLTEFSL